MVGIGYANVGSSARLNVGYNVLVNSLVIGINYKSNVNIGIEPFKILHRLGINRGLQLVTVTFRPEGDRIVLCSIKAFGRDKFGHCVRIIGGCVLTFLRHFSMTGNERKGN